MVDEQTAKKEEKKGEEKTVSNPVPGNQSQRPPTIEEVNAAAERLERATEAYRAENERAEKIYAMHRLGGMSGQGTNEEEKKEETPQEYAKRVMSNNI